MLPLSIYIHWPFCKSKCPYCDFNSHVRERIPEREWKEAYASELRYFKRLVPERRIRSVFFGGGTPSLMPVELVEDILTEISGLWWVEDGVEITLEANPTSVEREKFIALKRAGINRLSLGIQALNAEDLKFLGREHSAEEARAAIQLAATLFDRYSFDLIYARPHQTLAAWEKELREALSLAADHLSLYQLTIEPGTAFYHAYQQGKFTLPEEHTAAALFELTGDITSDFGLGHYEVSNYARAGSESRHNLAYWRYEEYIGVGPGAHGRIMPDGSEMRVATVTLKQPELWLEAALKQGHAICEQEVLSPRDQIDECVMMGLRLTEGLSFATFKQKAGADLLQNINYRKLERLVQEGLVDIDDHGIRTTPRGRLLLNQVTSQLLGIG